MNIMKFRLLGMAAAASLALVGCATTAPGYSSAPPPVSSSANCYDCGTVTRIDMIGSNSTVPNATGAVLGGLVGAAAGRKIADDESQGRQNTATVAGAVAGAVAGNAIQNRTQTASYNVQVRMNDGRTTVVTQKDLAGIREGSSVRVYNGRVWLR